MSFVVRPPLRGVDTATLASLALSLKCRNMVFHIARVLPSPSSRRSLIVGDLNAAARGRHGSPIAPPLRLVDVEAVLHLR
jgi:hypothetical protein